MPGVSPGATLNLSYLTIKDFDKIFYDTYLRPEPEYTQFLNVKNADANYYRVGQIAGFGALQDMTEGQAIPYEVMKQGNEKTVRYTNVGLGVQITENMREDDITGIIAQIPAMLAKAMLYTCELKGADILNSGFVTTYRTGLDGRALFATNHVLTDSTSTGSNLGTAGSLAETTLQALMDLMEATVTERNTPAPMTPKVLWIPYQLRWVAERLLLSEQRPESMDNDINTLRNKGLTFVVNHYFTSSTAYFLLTAKEDHDLQFIWRRKMKTANQDDFNTGSWMYKVTARLTADFFDWRGAAANAGA